MKALSLGESLKYAFVAVVVAHVGLVVFSPFFFFLSYMKNKNENAKAQKFTIHTYIIRIK